MDMTDDPIAVVIAELKKADNWKHRAALINQLNGKTDQRILEVIPGLLTQLAEDIDDGSKWKDTNSGKIQTEIESVVLAFGDDALPMIQAMGRDEKVDGFAVWCLSNLVKQKGSTAAFAELKDMLGRNPEFAVAQEIVMALTAIGTPEALEAAAQW